ncbi:MAG: metalloregulator ArsR/SmtB family transcription factor [Terriglobia bacterium]
MPNQSARLDDVFQSLGDPTRRAVLERLSSGPAAVSELARPFRMALPSFSQHLDVLENCGLVKSHKSGRIRTYRIVPRQLQVAARWLEKRRAHWEKRLDQLDTCLTELKENKTVG